MKKVDIKKMKEDMIKDNIRVEKETLSRYVKVLAKYDFARSSTSVIYFDNDYRRLLKHGFEQIDATNLSSKKKDKLRATIIGFFPDDKLSIPESNLKYYERLVSLAKGKLEELDQDLKETIINDAITTAELWSRQFDRNSKLYNKLEKLKVKKNKIKKKKP